MGMRKYVKDYDNEVKTDAHGREVYEPVYKGQYYKVNLSEAELKIFKRNLLLLGATVLALLFAAGFIRTGGTYLIYVGAPYALAFFPLFYLVVAALRLPKDKKLYRRDESELSFGRIKTTTMILLVMLIATSLGQVFYLVINRTNLLQSDFAFLSLLLLAVGFAVMLVKLRSKPLIEVDGDSSAPK